MTRTIPLAEQFRAQTLDDIVGQDHLFGNSGVISRIIATKRPLSILLWGPPGVGKTSIARLYAKAFGLHYVSFSAIYSSITDIKKIIQAQADNPLFQSSMVIFIDEIHRFNKAQQDAFLPYVENGTVILIGATTENPSFYLNSALLSRLRVLTLNPLSIESLGLLLKKYEQRFGQILLEDNAQQFLLESCQGDARYLFNLLETVSTLPKNEHHSLETISKLLQRRAHVYDKQGDYHYNLISALHKSVRSSDPDAALYWFARMLKGGEDPLFLARRLIRMASEDIGLADPEALKLAIAAKDSYEMLGSPEGELALAQVVLYLSLCPKSNAVYQAYKIACDLADKTSHSVPPKHILNAPTRLMKQLGYGENYIYDHDTEHGCSGVNNFPDDIERVELYQPVERGFEREMKKRLQYYDGFRAQKNRK